MSEICIGPLDIPNLQNSCNQNSVKPGWTQFGFTPQVIIQFWIWHHSDLANSY
jgi:hypothetical protein